MAVYLFAGIAVSDFAAAQAWYESLLGSPPSFFPHDTEAVWDLAESRLLYIVLRPEHAGHATHTVIVDDLDARGDDGGGGCGGRRVRRADERAGRRAVDDPGGAA